ncbi:hypothetical protein [Nitrospirillum iridis]|uniref:Lipoprotein n=1 Tax=Nitrospirillum iridis TaxID=765888 RepID=A0A7X0EC76_9PROT|nr:hypothetical protein [Nitrospirillum iridis]MBB6251338.1 hypothetical protein [Nitrospirillum iridis]
MKLIVNKASDFSLSRSHSVNIVIATALFVGLSGCGGRVANPVKAVNAYDDQLSCDHLRAELQVNQAHILDLNGERAADRQHNVGQLLVGPMFIDLSDSEKKEIKALEARDTVLNGYLAQRCPTDAAAPAPAAPPATAPAAASR